MEKLKQIEDINKPNHDNQTIQYSIEYQNSIDVIKNKVLFQLYDIVFTVYIELFNKYGFGVEMIENLIGEFKNLPNKYGLMKLNENFINSIFE